MLIKRFASTFMGMNSVFVSGNDKKGFLVDPGVYPAEIDKIKRFIEDKELEVDNLVLTHTHGDHISGWGEFSSFPVYASEKVLNKSEQTKNKDLAFVKKLYKKNDCDPSALKFPEPIFTVKDGAKEIMADLEVYFYEISGHAVDQVAVIVPALHLLLAGDMLIYKFIPIVLQGFNSYLEGLGKLKKLVEEYDIETVAPGHSVFARSYKDIDERIKNEENYIEEMLFRGRALLDEGCMEEQFTERLEKFFGYSPDLMIRHRLNIRMLYNELKNEMNN